MSESENNLINSNINQDNVSQSEINQNDTFDINELTLLNDDITSDFIEKLQNQVAENAKTFNKNTSDGDLFEDIDNKKNESENTNAPNLNSEIDDNFIKKYKAKLKKQQQGTQEIAIDIKTSNNIKNELNDNISSSVETKINENVVQEQSEVINSKKDLSEKNKTHQNSIEKVTGGNITERVLTDEMRDYSKSLDFADDNTKYSKYVIYIDPENEEFIESLTVKERKNLINKIIKEQNSIALAKLKIHKLKMFLLHIFLVILTIAITIPCLYKIINTSLEITIDNYHNSQSMFEVLYKQKGKIKPIKK